MYNQNSLLIVLVLFLLIMIAHQIGLSIGKFRRKTIGKEFKHQILTIQSSFFTLLMLILGFTFNMALQRHDNRNIAQINEAHSIGTAILRTNLLKEPFAHNLKPLMKKYVALRKEINKFDLNNSEERTRLNHDVEAVQEDMWQQALLAAQADPNPVTSGLFISSLNELIDNYGKRNAILQLYVPEVILFLLFLIFIISGAMLGYSSGLSEKRVLGPTIMLFFFIVLVVFIIIDLDRPTRGFIQISQDSIEALKVE